MEKANLVTTRRVEVLGLQGREPPAGASGAHGVPADRAHRPTASASGCVLGLKDRQSLEHALDLLLQAASSSGGLLHQRGVVLGRLIKDANGCVDLHNAHALFWRPQPCSPARAASTAALSARMLV